jgi:hypothetical protein
MQLRPAPRKYMLIVHLIFSIGWLGAIATFLALAIGGVVSENTGQVRSFYIALEPVSCYVILPLSIGAFVSGVILSLGTPWGLFRYYWIVIKLLSTTVGTSLLLLHIKYIHQLAALAADHIILKDESRPLRIQLLRDGAGALILLIALTVLSVVKPWGKVEVNSMSRTWRYILFGLTLLLAFILILHLAGGGHHAH